MISFKTIEFGWKIIWIRSECRMKSTQMKNNIERKVERQEEKRQRSALDTRDLIQGG